MSVRRWEKALLQKQILKQFVVAPAIGIEIANIGRKDAAMPQVFGQNHKRSVGQIHWQICIFFHQLVDTSGVFF